MIGAAATLTAEEEAAGAIPHVMSDVMEKKLVEAGYSKDEFLLATDTAVVIPVGKTVVVQVTGSDVIHAWTIPAWQGARRIRGHQAHDTGRFELIVRVGPRARFRRLFQGGRPAHPNRKAQARNVKDDRRHQHTRQRI
jgi:hypothetical protein